MRIWRASSWSGFSRYSSAPSFLHRSLHCPEGGHDDDRDGRLEAFELAQQRETVHFGHLQIENENIVALLARPGEGCQAAPRGVDGKTRACQETGQDHEDGLLVIDDQYVARRVTPVCVRRRQRVLEKLIWQILHVRNRSFTAFSTII